MDSHISGPLKQDCGYMYIDAANDVLIMTNAGVPDATVGAGLAGKGSICTDRTNGTAYVNKGTKTTPSWKLVTQAA
jgi:hypothetical protein